MVVTRGGSYIGVGASGCSGSGSGTGVMDDRMREFISSEVTHNIIEQTPVIFGTIKEGIMELLDERLGAFHVEIRAMVGARSLNFWEFRACGASEIFGKKDLISSRRWLADIANAFRTSCCPEEVKIRYASCLLKDRARD